MSIMDFFSAAKGQQQVEATKGNANANVNNNSAVAVKADENKQQQNANNPAKDPENPFDVYTKLFETAATNSDIQAPSFSIDPKVVAEVSGKMDFTKGINPELIQKATNGDAASMIQLIQEVGRNSYRASLEHTTKLTDTHLGQRSEFEGKKLRQGVKQELTMGAFDPATNPQLNHPVVRTELNRIASQFAAANPDATPQEIAGMAKKYFSDIYNVMNPSEGSSGKSGKGGKNSDDGFDYFAYITGAQS